MNANLRAKIIAKNLNPSTGRALEHLITVKPGEAPADLIRIAFVMADPGQGITSVLFMAPGGGTAMVIVTCLGVSLIANNEELSVFSNDRPGIINFLKGFLTGAGN